jgi:dCTP deaminase
MIINGQDLWELAPITDMANEKYQDHGVSYGLGEAGYDIRLKQDITFNTVQSPDGAYKYVVVDGQRKQGYFALGSSIEHFNMPITLTGIVHDKSTWARQGLSVFNTVIEPGWNGYLTLELVYHGHGELIIPAGAGIAQVIFHRVSCPIRYKGKYQNQEDAPIPAIFEQGPIRIIDDQGTHPSNLDRAVEEQRIYYQKGFGPGEAPLMS